MKKSLLIGVLMASCFFANAQADQRLKDSQSTRGSEVKRGMGNPYLPDVACNYNTEKLWFDNDPSVMKWRCVNDRTKTGG